MMKQYIIIVRDKSQIDFLKSCGEVIHIAKLRNLIVFESSKDIVSELSNHPQVISARESEICFLV